MDSGLRDDLLMNSSWSLAHIIAAMACIAGLVLFLFPASATEAQSLRSAAVIVIAIGLWATAVVPEYFTSIIFFFLAVTAAGVSPKVVFSGFGSAAAWLVFSGLVIAVAMQSTGLGSRIATTLARYVGASYYSLLARTVIAVALLGFILPSNMGRVLVMLPIFLSMADRFGFAKGSNGRAAITLAVAGGSLYPGFGILTAAVPNIVLLGAAENIHQIRISYARYLLLQFPIISVVSVIALPLIIKRLFPAQRGPDRPAGPAGPWSQQEYKLLIVLLLTLGLWTTDFYHRVSPAWIAMGAAVLSLLPRLGTLPASSLIEKLNLGPWFFMTGILGMGAVLTTSGVGDLVGDWLVTQFRLAPGHDVFNFAALSAAGMLMSIAATVPGEPVIIATIAHKISAATGWPVETVLLAQVTNWSMALFPYELPPFIVAATLGGVRANQVIKLLVAMTGLAWLVIVPLQFLWWRYLGYFSG